MCDRREKAYIVPYFIEDKGNLGQEHMLKRDMYCRCARLINNFT